MSELLLLAFGCFGTMGVGWLVARSGLLSPEARKGAATLYAKLVFPCMVFRGVAAIRAESVDPWMVGTILIGKMSVALACIVFFRLALVRQYGHTSLAVSPRSDAPHRIFLPLPIPYPPHSADPAPLPTILSHPTSPSQPISHTAPPHPTPSCIPFP